MEEKKLDGAFENVTSYNNDSSFSGDNIKVFRNGYWISASFDETFLVKCSGGVYKTVNGRCLLTYQFNFPDSIIIGTTDTMNFSLENGEYLTEEVSYKNSTQKHSFKNKYIKITTTRPLENSLLEGVWNLKGRQIGEIKNFDDMEDGGNIIEIKIYTYPYVAWAQYNLKSKKFIGAGGGTYQLDRNNNLTERYQFMTYPVPPGTELKGEIIKLSANEVLQVNPDRTFEENWEKIK
jgi:hypothetical protein